MAAQPAYAWPDREFNARQYIGDSYLAGPNSLYGPGANTARGYEPFQTVAAGVAPGSTCRALIVGGIRRAVRIGSAAIPPPP